MNHNQIHLNKERSFGELFNATFSFIKNEFSELMKSILYFAIPPLVVASVIRNIISRIQQAKIAELQNNAANTNLTNPLELMKESFNSPLIYVNHLLMFFTSVILATTVLEYLKLYHQKGSGNFKTIDVWNEIKKDFGRLLGTTFLVTILTTIGVFLCILPGIYLAVILCAVLPIVIFESKGFSAAFNKSIELVKGSFWSLLGSLIVILLVCYLLVIVTSLPGIFVGIKSVLFNPKEIEVSSNFSFTFYLINAIVYIVQQIILTIPIVFTTFIYFSQLEKKEKPSLEQRINEISENE